MNSYTYSTRSISFGYGDTSVVDELSLTFDPGKLHVILGPNGSGKSTLLDLLAGHHLPHSGTINLGNTPLCDLTPAELARITAMVPQEFNFNFPFTVFDAVLMGRHPHIPRFARPSDEDLRIVHRSLETMDITRLADRSLADLSGGEKQRTVVARALAQTTPCLLLDEPTSSMDIRHALATLSELRRLAHDSGCTIITVLHDLNLAAAYGDTITILRDGRLHTHGTARNTLTPSIIHDVFGVSAMVKAAPQSGCPVITYDSKEQI